MGERARDTKPRMPPSGRKVLRQKKKKNSWEHLGNEKHKETEDNSRTEDENTKNVQDIKGKA